MAEIKRVRVKFLDSLAGLRDPTPALLAAKYARIAESMAAETQGGKSKLPLYSEAQIRAAVDSERRKDEAVIRTGFVKDWAFKPGEEASVNAEIAREWEAGGVCVVPEKKG